jgi:predicted nucleotidyltransferase
MLSKSQINAIIKILKPYNPKKIGLFGSVARSEETKESDIDILYDFAAPVTLINLVEMQNKLQSVLHKKIDLVSENAIHPKLKDYILNDLRIIYEN